MTLHLVGSLGFAARAFVNHLILQSAGQGHYALLLAVGCQKGFALLTAYGAGLFARFLLAALTLGQTLLHNLLCLLVAQLRLLTCQNITHGGGKVGHFQMFQTQIFQLVADGHAQRIT